MGIGLMALVVFLPRLLQTGHTWPQAAHSIYRTFDKPLFVLGIIFTILPTVLGASHSFFNTLLTSKLFNFIARISFCTYLMHLFPLMQFEVTRNYDLYMSTSDVFVLYTGILVLSLFLGLVLTLTVELPFANLQKHLMKKVLGGG